MQSLTGRLGFRLRVAVERDVLFLIAAGLLVLAFAAAAALLTAA